MTGPPVISPLARALGDGFVAGWQGVPFAWDGRDLTGIDCWGLVVAFHAEVLGQALPDWRRGEHGRAWIGATFAREAQGHFRPLPAAVDGAIVLSFRARAPHHAGIVWRGSVLHADDGRGQVVFERVTDFVTLHPRAAFGAYAP
jgi:cell wall-associated NlpC family hydrolase